MNPQLLIEHFPLQITKQTIVESSSRNGGKLILEGIIQRANAKNQNGRVYPKEILEREIEAYKQGPIAEHRSTGELDHPECFIEGYKILTLEKGWINFKDLLGTENVATINPLTKELEYQTIQKVINQPYSGDIINIESKTFQANVTPNHRFLVTSNYDAKNEKNLKFKLATDLLGTDLIPKTSNYSKIIKDKVIIENEKGKIEISSGLFASFMGWWLSEGWLRTRTNKNREGYGIFISQSDKKPNNVLELKILFNQLSNELECKWNVYKKKNNENEFYLFNKILNIYLSQFGLCDEKYIPKEIKELDKENIQIFLDSYLKGDGSKQKNQEVYYTTSKQMALDISELINLTGFMSSESQKELFFEKYLVEGVWVKDFDWYTKKEKFQGKLIEDKKKHYTGRILYSIRRKYSKYYHINDCNITKSQYKGQIYCVSVPNETILVMSPNGSTFWSGNSQVINLKNVCHRITEVWWDGDDVKAKLLILDTPSGNIVKALIKGGVQIGISSRAMGSVQNLGEGTVEVQDDLSLVCWDIVSEPSTQGAFVKPIGLNENYQPQINTKYNKLNEIISDIICFESGVCCLR